MSQFLGLAADIARLARIKGVLSSVMKGNPVSFSINRMDPAKLNANEANPFVQKNDILLEFDPAFGFFMVFEPFGEEFATAFSVNEQGCVTSFDNLVKLDAREMTVTGRRFNMRNADSIADLEAYAQQLAERHVADWGKLAVPETSTGEEPPPL
jgi:hypothetical protein